MDLFDQFYDELEILQEYLTENNKSNTKEKTKLMHDFLVSGLETYIYIWVKWRFLVSTESVICLYRMFTCSLFG